MIRKVKPEDAKDITAIYNHYIQNSVITFETEPLHEEEMQKRIAEISAEFPFFVFEEENQVAGYCYAHPWKQKAAYRHTVETTVYLSPEHTGKGIGRLLMEKLIEACRESGYYALIACITAGNEVSNSLHSSLGFKQVSYFEKVGLKFGKRLDVIDYELLLDT